jgi:hypothetical protein
MAKATGFGGAVLRADDPGKRYAGYEAKLGLTRGTMVDLARGPFDDGRFGWFTNPEGNRVGSWQPFS